MSETDFSGHPASAFPEKPERSERSEGFASLRNAETFAAYCAEVQSRLAEHALHRRHFLQTAQEKLIGLLAAARAVEDETLSNELQSRLTAVHELLDSLHHRDKPTHSVVSAPVANPLRPISLPSISQTSLTPHTNHPATNGYHSDSSSMPHAHPPIADAGTGSITPHDPNAPRLPRRPVRPLPDIEAEAIQVRGDLHDWSEHTSLTDPDGSLNVPNLLRLRAIACRQRKLEEEAGDTEVAEVTELGEDIEAIMDEVGDEEYTVALDYELDPLPTAYQWGELAERYDEMAHAYDAFEWWNRNWTHLTVQEVQPLAEAVAAIQQRFNRLLFRIGARDPYQQILFDDLRTWAREAQCYLHSLRPKVPIAELIERAATLISAWEGAKIPVVEAKERNRLLHEVETMISEDTFGMGGEIDELRLHNLLLECREAKISPSDKRLRDALLPWGAFLEGEDRFRDILRDVNLEWERRQDAERPEDYEPEPPEALLPLQNELAAVREITRGKRFVLLGGTPREDVKQKIGELFEFASIEWLRTRPDLTSADFAPAISEADAVGLFTRFSRKEWKHVEAMARRDGRKFWRFNSRYHPSHLVKSLYRDEIAHS